MKLKPCPFCGGEAELFSNERHTSSGVGCRPNMFKRHNLHPDFTIFGFRNDEEAIKAWNRRVK